MATDTEARVQGISDLMASLNILSAAISELLTRQIHEELGKELTLSQFQLLKLVEHTDAERITDVAAFLGVSTAAASKAVERLARRGFLRREGASDDRRVMHLRLTPRGKHILARYEDVHYRTLSRIFEGCVPADFHHTADALDRLSVEVIRRESTPSEICFRCGIYFRDKCLLRKVTNRGCYCHLHDTSGEDGIADEPVEGGSTDGETSNPD